MIHRTECIHLADRVYRAGIIRFDSNEVLGLQMTQLQNVIFFIWIYFKNL